MTAFLDTNVLVRHLTGDIPARRGAPHATSPAPTKLLLADLILAEVAYVLESYYEAPRTQVATSLRAVLAFPAVRVVDLGLLQRAVEIYDVERLDFAEAYLVACAERAGSARSPPSTARTDRVPTVRRNRAQLMDDA